MAQSPQCLSPLRGLSYAATSLPPGRNPDNPQPRKWDRGQGKYLTLLYLMIMKLGLDRWGGSGGWTRVLRAVFRLCPMTLFENE